MKWSYWSSSKARLESVPSESVSASLAYSCSGAENVFAILINNQAKLDGLQAGLQNIVTSHPAGGFEFLQASQPEVGKRLDGLRRLD